MARSARTRRLEIDRMDRSFRNLRNAGHSLLAPPPDGWVKTIREALGMSAKQLARRLGVSRAAVYQLEARETDRKVSLKQLDKAAAALDCEVVYTLIPRQSLADAIRGRAKDKAEYELRAANVSMGLEAEGVEDSDFAATVTSVASYTEALTDRYLWDD